MKYFEVDLKGYVAKLPVLPLPSGISIAFFNLHGNQEMTEHCGKELAKMVSDCDVLLTAESKGLQLTHVIARELGQPYYAVARKSRKLYMQDGIEVEIKSSITTGAVQKLYLSRHDTELLKGKKVGIIDDVVSTGASLQGLEKLVELAGGKIQKQAFVLAEGDAAHHDNICFLGVIPIFDKDGNPKQ
ncbi:MAG: adenine phosphoribosyltransferase [Clostridia bacterium]|nr:adenine phosphoribosyltransferase [Clostridia bacterium]